MNDCPDWQARWRREVAKGYFMSPDRYRHLVLFKEPGRQFNNTRGWVTWRSKRYLIKFLDAQLIKRDGPFRLVKCNYTGDLIAIRRKGFRNIAVVVWENEDF